VGSRFNRTTFYNGPSGATPLEADAAPNRWEGALQAIDDDLDDAQDQISALQAGGGNGGYVYGTTYPAPTLGNPPFFNTGNHKIYYPGGDGWYDATGTLATGTGTSNAPQNFTAVINSDSTTSLSWSAVTSATAYTVREKFLSPGGVSGMPITGSPPATTNTRSAQLTAQTREYYVTATVGGVESAESTHITLYYPFGSLPPGGGGGGGGGGTSPASILQLGAGKAGGRYNLGVGRGAPTSPPVHVDIDPGKVEGGYYEADYFYVNAAGTGVTFREHMDGGKTSSHTNYPRTEMREFTQAGAQMAFNVGSGRHTYEYEMALEHIPPNKPWTTAGQLHDSVSDAVAFKWKPHSGTDRTNMDLTCWIYDTQQSTPLLTGYDGTQGTSAVHVIVKFDVFQSGGVTVFDVWVNGTKKISANNSLNGKGSGHYWKYGSYGQTSSSYGGFESTTEYVDVTYYYMHTTHTPAI